MAFCLYFLFNKGMVNMTLGIVATKSTQEIVQGMNFRGNLDIRILEHKQLRELVQTIESQPCFSHILLDVEAVQGNSDDFIQLLFRLRQSTTVEYLVLLEGYPSDSRVVKELLDLGIESKNILFSSALALRQRLVEIFYYPSSQITPFCPTKPMNETPEDDETIEQSLETQDSQKQEDVTVPKALQDPLPATMGIATLPPSEITTAQAHAVLQEKMLAIQKENCKTALRIAVAGAGNRIGTTTQALQILLHLKLQNKAVALIEMHNHPCLAAYADVYSDAELHKDFCTVNGNRLYFSPDCLPTIQKEYEYLILDFGNFQECSHELFLQSDIKIICCGIKPWETAAINYTFRENDGSFQYLFSFVPPADETDITKQMEEFSQHTFFASYSPDMFQYNGCDDMYCKLLECSDMVSDL